MTIIRYRLVKYEADTQELMNDELYRSIKPTEPVFYKDGLMISVRDVNQDSNDGLRIALMLLLDQIDYIAGNCRVNEQIGAVLPASLLAKVKMELNGIGPEDMQNDIAYPPEG